MIIRFGLPLRLWQSWIYCTILFVTIFFIIVPTSIIMYLHFQSSIIPEQTPTMKLQFQYLESTGPYAFYNLTDTSYEQVRPWKETTKTAFTQIQQILSVHLKYIKLTPGSEVGGIRMSVYDNDNSPILHKSETSELTKQWPFKPLSISSNAHEFNLYRADRSFKSWRQVIGKSYAKSVPFINYSGHPISSSSLMDYFAPSWILSVFVPKGIREILSWENITYYLGRSDFKVRDNRIQTIDLLDSFGDYNGCEKRTISAGFILFDGELQYEDLLNTSLLVELDLNDIFIVDGYVSFDYVLSGIRWWVYWWPGFSMMIGVSILIIVSCLGFLSVTWLGVISWTLVSTFSDTPNTQLKLNN